MLMFDQITISTFLNGKIGTLKSFPKFLSYHILCIHVDNHCFLEMLSVILEKFSKYRTLALWTGETPKMQEAQVSKQELHYLSCIHAILQFSAVAYGLHLASQSHFQCQ